MKRGLCGLAIIAGLLPATPASASGALVQKKICLDSSPSAASMTCSWTSPTGANHVIVVVRNAGFASGTTHTSSISGTAETWLNPADDVAVSGSRGISARYTLTSVGGDTTYTINYSGTETAGQNGLVMYEFSMDRTNGAPSVDAHNHSQNATGAANPSGQVLTIGGSVDIIVQAINFDTDPTAINLSYTEDSIRFGIATAYLLNTTNGTAPTWTANAGGNTSNVFGIAFKEAVAGGAPASPSSPSPANGATGVSTGASLSWTASGATSYDVYFGDSNPPPLVSTGQAGNSYTPTLNTTTTYFWKITAINGTGSTNGTIWSFTTGSASGRTFYVNNASSDCTSAAGSGTLLDPWQNLFHALTANGFGADDLIILRGGTYKNVYNHFSSLCVPPGYTVGQGVVLPLSNMAGTSGHDVIIQNFPGEDVIIDGTNATPPAWGSCGATGYSTSTYTTGSPQTAQLWYGSTGPTDPGIRLKHSGSSCGGLNQGEFSQSGNVISVRLAGDANPAAQVFRISVQQGDGSWTPLAAIQSSVSYVTVRKNPVGGTFTVRTGYFCVYVDGGANHLTFDGLNIIGCGGSDYGQGVRTYGGNNITVKNVLVKETMSEGVAFYGGGPGCGTGNGCAIQIHDNLLDNSEVVTTGRAYLDGGGLNSNLGMGVILKSCNTCTVQRSKIHDNVALGIIVTTPANTSTDAGVTTNGAVIDRNEIYNYGYQSAAAGIRNAACVEVVLQASGPSSTTLITGVTITNNWCHNEAFTGFAGVENPFGVLFDSGGGKDGSGGFVGPSGTLLIANNSFNSITSSCISLYFLGTPAILRNNAMANCGTGNVGSAAFGAHVALDAGATAHTHDHNDYWSGASADLVANINGTTYARSGITSYEATALAVNPQYASATDPHIPTGSGLKDAGTNTSCPSVDIDGGSRPVNSICDIGADEYSVGGGGSIFSRRGTGGFDRAGSRGGTQ